MMRGRMPPGVRQRLAFLWAGNLALLLIIRLLLKEGGSFKSVLGHSGPDLAPTILAALGMTGIIFTGAIDLSVASVIAVAGTVFGILVHYGAAPMVCDTACILTAWLLASLLRPADDGAFAERIESMYQHAAKAVAIRNQ